MATTIRQTKHITATVNDGDQIDLAPDNPTLPGSVIVILWYMANDGFNSAMHPYEVTIPVEDVNVYSGWGNAGASNDTHYAGMFFGPAQPMLADYHKIRASVTGPTEVNATLYEISSDLGPIVPYGNYQIRSVEANYEIEAEDWVAVYTGYNKPRPTVAFAITPGSSAPYPHGLSNAASSFGDGSDSVKGYIEDVDWGPGEHHLISMDSLGFLALFNGFVEQSRYNTVQHIEKTGTNTITLADDGVPVAMKNLMLMSARYKNPPTDLAIEKWNLISRDNTASDDNLTAVLWWRQQDGSNMDVITVPGSPLNLNYREVGGFDDNVRLGVFAMLNGGLNESSPPDPSDDENYLEWIRTNYGIVASVGNFPNNDAYFYSAVAWEDTKEFVMSLPEPTIKLNRAFIDTGDGWDWFPDGMGSQAKITAMGGSPGGGFSSDSNMFEDMAGIGAIFYNKAPVSTTVPNPRWVRTREPDLNYALRYMDYQVEQLLDQINELENQTDLLLVPPTAGNKNVIDLGDASGDFVVPYDYNHVTVNGVNAGPFNIYFANPGAGKFAKFRLVLDLSAEVLGFNSLQPGSSSNDTVDSVGTWDITVIGGEGAIQVFTSLAVV